MDSYFGPRAPKAFEENWIPTVTTRYESNWIKTVRGKGCASILRFDIRPRSNKAIVQLVPTRTHLIQEPAVRRGCSLRARGRGPLEPWFNKTWRPGGIVEVK